MSEIKKVPMKRFSGFTEFWNQSKLGEVGSTYTGLSGKSRKDFGHGEGWYVTYMNVYTNGISNLKMIEPIEIDVMQNEVKYGDVFFTTSSETPEEVGMSSVWLENSKYVYLNSFCFGYRPKEKFDNYFLAYMLRSSGMRNRITFLAQGISRYNISKNKVLDITVGYPEMAEQIKIGSFFNELDKLIDLNQKKLLKLKNLKKATLEKMLPKFGTNIPELRFKEFNEGWKQCKLGEVSNLLTGYPFESKHFIQDGIPLVRGMNVKRNYLDMSKKICEYWPSYKGLELYLLKDKDILIQMDGALIGESYARIVENQLPALLVQRVTRVRSNSEDINIDFIYQTIQRGFSNHIKGIKTETAVPHLSLNDIRDFKIMIPKIEEQIKIVQTLDYFDNLIKLQYCKLDKLINIKNSFLNEMFA